MNYIVRIAILIVSITTSLFGQTVGIDQLKIQFNNTNNGVTVSSILDDNTEILHIADEIFTLKIRNINTSAETSIISAANWGATNVVLSNGDKDCTITLSNPNLVGIPNSLVAVVTVNTSGNQSQWDLSVSGLGANHSLINTVFPNLIIKGAGGKFLIPRYSGQEMPNPASGINYVGKYPRGNATNMQFMAYYDADADVYFGFHDPGAASKTFQVINASGGVRVNCALDIPNQTVADNNWEYPGHFELDLFAGNWYQAAMIYKDWASNNADYWPHDTPERQLRQAELGKIGVWFNDIGYYNGNARSSASIQLGTQKCIDYLPGIPLATHLYTWNGKPNDDSYPELFPMISGLDNSIETLQNNGAYIIPYFNGRLYDTLLTSYNPIGLPDAAKNEAGNYYFQNFRNSDSVWRRFGVMCPTQPTWQSIVADAADSLTNGLHTKGIYLDQVSAAAYLPCMDINHGHPIGGGSYWREGYATLLDGVLSSMPNDRFITVEGACDYMLDRVDGLLVDPWDKENMVPAFPAIYAGKIQMFGTRTGTNTYNDASFYTQLAQTFCFGIQPGRFTVYIIDDPNSQAIAKPYVKTLATMRYKLREFMSFGEMKYPLTVTPINPNPIPDITSNWGSTATPRNVTISALQSSIWQKEDSVAVVFANASMNGTDFEFSFDFDGADYGMTGDLLVREVTETSNGSFATVNNTFNQTVILGPRDIKAYVIKAVNVLPITMISSFSGEKVNNIVALKWATGLEKDFDKFEIQRSSNGTDWYNIGSILGKGNNNTLENHYQFEDKSPNKSINYYRLKEIDMDGSYTFSDIILIAFEQDQISVYPNPSKGKIWIAAKDYSVDKITIYNELGQEVFEQVNPAGAIDISHLPKGIHTLLIHSDNSVKSQTIVLK